MGVTEIRQRATVDLCEHFLHTEAQFLSHESDKETKGGIKQVRGKVSNIRDATKCWAE